MYVHCTLCIYCSLICSWQPGSRRPYGCNIFSTNGHSATWASDHSEGNEGLGKCKISKTQRTGCGWSKSIKGKGLTLFQDWPHISTVRHWKYCYCKSKWWFLDRCWKILNKIYKNFKRCSFHHVSAKYQGKSVVVVVVVQPALPQHSVDNACSQGGGCGEEGWGGEMGRWALNETTSVDISNSLPRCGQWYIWKKDKK